MNVFAFLSLNSNLQFSHSAMYLMLQSKFAGHTMLLCGKICIIWHLSSEYLVLKFYLDFVPRIFQIQSIKIFSIHIMTGDILSGNVAIFYFFRFCNYVIKDKE